MFRSSSPRMQSRHAVHGTDVRARFHQSFERFAPPTPQGVRRARRALASGSFVQLMAAASPVRAAGCAGVVAPAARVAGGGPLLCVFFLSVSSAPSVAALDLAFAHASMA